VWDVDGQRRLVDCHCNCSVFNLGHRHPRIVATLRLDTYGHYREHSAAIRQWREQRSSP
jgi:acetylornithine/succinyldiaminopimelate/putrescine aminotransferase